MICSSIFLNYQFIKADKKLLDELTPGVIDRRGVFETTLFCNGKIFAWIEHIQRLRKGLRSLKIKIPCPGKKLLAVSRDVIRKNKLKNGSLRISIWEDGGINLAVVVKPHLVDKKIIQGFSLTASSFLHRKIKFSHLKSLEYSSFRKVFLQAQKKGYDEAILLNNRGQVVEGSRSNIFCVKDNVVMTPSAASGCLEGIARQKVIAFCKRLKIKCQIGHLRVNDLMKADEVFCTNSVSGLISVKSINHKAVGSGKPGSISRQLEKAWVRLVSENLT